MGESVFDKKRRVRPPRVNISYEVELNGAKQMKELPFVVGVLADLGAQSKKDPGKLKDRKFVEVDRDNFDDILKSLQPRVAMKVENKLKNDGSELSVELNFEKLADFSPDAVVQQVDPLKKLLEMRNQLKDLQSRTEGNDRLEELLNAIIDTPEVRDKLKETLGAEAASLSGDEGESGGGGDGDDGGEG